MAMSSHGGKRLLTVVLDFASFNLYMKTNSTLRSYFQAYTYLGKHLNYFIFDDKTKVKTIWFPFGFLAYWRMSWRWKLLFCSCSILVSLIFFHGFFNCLNWEKLVEKIGENKIGCLVVWCYEQDMRFLFWIASLITPTYLLLHQLES